MKTILALLGATCLLLLAACGAGGGNSAGAGDNGSGAVTPPATGTPITFDISAVRNAHLGAGYMAFINVFGTVTSLTISGQLPPGIQATINGGVTLTGNPTQTGSFPFTLQAVGKPGVSISANQNVTLTVDTALGIVELSMGAGVVGKAYQFQLHSVNGTGPYVWSYTNPVAGLTLDPASGLVNGVPLYFDPGNTQVTVTDSSSPPQTATQWMPFPINFPLSQGSSAFSAFLRTPFNNSMTIGGGQTPLHISLISGSLPPGIGLNSPAGQFSGTATQVGNFSFTLQVQDSATPPQNAQFTDTISVASPPLTLAANFPAVIPQGVPLDIFLAGNGGNPPYRFSLNQGALPSGLSLNRSTGEISGTPTALGNYPFQVTLSDSSNPNMHTAGGFSTTVQAALGRNDMVSHATPLGGGGEASISPYSDPVGSPTPAPDQDYYKVASVNGSVLTIGVTSDYGSSFDPVLEIVDANGVRMSSCRPSGSLQPLQQPCLAYHVQGGLWLDVQVPGSAAVYPHVLDYRGDARPDFNYFISVSGTVYPLQVSSTVQPLVLGSNSSQALTATGGMPPYFWTVQNGTLPPGMALTQGGQLAGTPTAVGSYTVQLLVSDSGTIPQIATQNFSIPVYPALLVTAAALPDGKVGVPYSLVLTSQGGYPPIQWGGDCGLQYPELSVSNNGILMGTPKTAGQTTCYLSAQDSSAGPAHGGQVLPLIIQP